jgi:hypothetical protein
MVVLGVGIGLVMQNLVLAAQNDVPARELGAVVENAYGAATADLFMMSVPFAVLALVAVVFIKEKPLQTTSGAERRAHEEAAGKLSGTLDE